MWRHQEGWCDKYVCHIANEWRSQRPLFFITMRSGTERNDLLRYYSVMDPYFTLSYVLLLFNEFISFICFLYECCIFSRSIYYEWHFYDDLKMVKPFIC